MRLEELKVALGKRDSDNARLRENRDTLQTEVHERRSKDSERADAAKQFKALASSRGVSFNLSYLIALEILNIPFRHSRNA